MVDELRDENPFTFTNGTYFVSCETKVDLGKYLSEMYSENINQNKNVKKIVDVKFNDILIYQINLLKGSKFNDKGAINIFEMDDFYKSKNPEITKEKLEQLINDNLTTDQLVITNKSDKKLLKENIKMKNGSTEIIENDESIIYKGITEDNKILTFTYNKNNESSEPLNIEINSENFVIK